MSGAGGPGVEQGRRLLLWVEANYKKLAVALGGASHPRQLAASLQHQPLCTATVAHWLLPQECGSSPPARRRSRHPAAPCRGQMPCRRGSSSSSTSSSRGQQRHWGSCCSSRRRRHVSRCGGRRGGSRRSGRKQTFAGTRRRTGGPRRAGGGRPWPGLALHCLCSTVLAALPSRAPRVAVLDLIASE